MSEDTIELTAEEKKLVNAANLPKERAINWDSDARRAALEMLWGKGFSYRTIGRMLHVSSGAISNAMFRYRKQYGEERFPPRNKQSGARVSNGRPTGRPKQPESLPDEEEKEVSERNLLGGTIDFDTWETDPAISGIEPVALFPEEGDRPVRKQCLWTEQRGSKLFTCPNPISAPGSHFCTEHLSGQYKMPRRQEARIA